MITFYYDIVTSALVDSDGQRLSTDSVRLAYQANPTWRVTFVQADPIAQTITAVDVSSATAWAAAVDDDFDHDSEPMCRTLDANIDSSDAANGNIDVELDANTATFEAAVGTQNLLRNTYFEVRGLGAGSEVLYYAKFVIIADNTVDPSGGSPPAPVGDYYTKTETDAIVNGLRDATVAVNPKAVASTVLYTVPSGYWFIPLFVPLQCLTITADGTGATWKLKTAAGDVTIALAESHAAVNDVHMVQCPMGTAYPAGTVFSIEVTIASTHSVHTARAALHGILYATS